MNLDVSGVRAMENPKAEGRACRFFAISDHGGVGGGAEDGEERSRRRIIAAWLFQDAGGTTTGTLGRTITDGYGHQPRWREPWNAGSG